MNPTGVRIAGVGHFVPPRVLANSDFERMFDTSDEWITSRTGMRERRIAADDVATSDLAIAAGRRALESAKLEPHEIDCVVVATATPDYSFPATACIVAAALGMTGKPAFDISIACSGFIYGLTMASSMVRSGVFRRMLLIGAEKLSSITNYEERTTAILFGDGAGAVVLEACEADSFLAAELGADGTSPENLYIPGGGSKLQLTPDLVAAKYHKLRMNGREVFRFAVTKMIEATNIALDRAGIAAGEVAYLIPHQANKRIIDAAAKHLSLPVDRVIVNIQNYGNTSAASIPIALSETYDAGKLTPGDVLLFVGFGGGLSWGAVAWRWSMAPVARQRVASGDASIPHAARNGASHNGVAHASSEAAPA